MSQVLITYGLGSTWANTVFQIVERLPETRVSLLTVDLV
jgi:hypothetical protein